MRDPHQNIFFYYRGPSNKRSESSYDIQIEDNTTKSLINLLEFCHEVKFKILLDLLLEEIKVKKKPILFFRLQEKREISRPDAYIHLVDHNIYIESKVRASLDLDQIKRHLKSLNPEDCLLVVTNNKRDYDNLRVVKDKRVKFLTWSDIHKICLGVAGEIKDNKKMAATFYIINQFLDYLEVVVMTEFSGFKNEDFDFWIDFNPYYVEFLKNKLKALAQIIKNELPKEIKAYSEIKSGNVSEKGISAWVAIKKPEDKGGIFHQCNFTIEVSKNSLDINAVIRNGRTSQKNKPLGVFYNKISRSPDDFLRAIKKIRENIMKKARIVIYKRVPKTGEKIKPGNERWERFFEINLHDMTMQEDVHYLKNILAKADIKPALPGIHIKYSIDRGSKILSKPVELVGEIISTIISFKPILEYLEGK